MKDDTKDFVRFSDDDSYAMEIIEGVMTMIPLTYEESMEMQVDEMITDITIHLDRMMKKYCA